MKGHAGGEPFGFERLEVWQKAMSLAGTIYEFTKAFPKSEMFGLTTQLRRAAVSVAANIAEGSSRTTGKDQARFFEIAFGSLNEVTTMLHIARGQNLISDEEFQRIRGEVSDIGRMLSGLKRTALTRSG